MGRLLRDSWNVISGAASTVLPRVRGLLASRPARRRALRRVGALAAAAAALAVTRCELAEADAVRDRWEATVEVLVARRDLELGAGLPARAYRTELRPPALVPEGALRSAPADGSVVSARILAGEPLVADRVAAPGEAATRVPPGHSSVELEVRGGAPSSTPGDRVDVFAAGADPITASVVARGALVLEGGSTDGARSITLAVRDQDVPSTTAAALLGEVVVVERGPDG